MDGAAGGELMGARCFGQQAKTCPGRMVIMTDEGLCREY